MPVVNTQLATGDAYCLQQHSAFASVCVYFCNSTASKVSTSVVAGVVPLYLPAPHAVHAEAPLVELSLLRCQYLYFCTSKESRMNS